MYNKFSLKINIFWDTTDIAYVSKATASIRFQAIRRNVVGCQVYCVSVNIVQTS
jgi:hypothetical protein